MNFFDFASGHKTTVFSIFTVATIVFNLFFKVEIDTQDLMSTFEILMTQSETIYGAVGIIYGALMKLYKSVK